MLLQTGNPAKAHQVRLFSKGYGNEIQAASFRATAAKPMSEGKITLLLTHISTAAFEPSSRSAFDSAILLRDGVASCLLWHTGLRGINASDCLLDGLILPGQGRGSIRAYLHSQQPIQMQHLGSVQVHPLRTKTCSEKYSIVTVQPSALLALDLWFWILAVYTNAILIHQPISQYMVRATGLTSRAQPAVQGHRALTLTDRQLCSSGLSDRLCTHLSKINAYEGESTPSFRERQLPVQAQLRAAQRSHQTGYAYQK